MANQQRSRSSDTAQETFEEDDDLRCSVCLRTLCEPRMLPCLHTMCTHCIDGLIEAAMTSSPGEYSRSKITCPLCRNKTTVHPTRGSSSLPLNTLAQAALQQRSECASFHYGTQTLLCGTCDDQSAAVTFCQDCDKPVCDSCTRMHSKLLVFRGHSLCSLGDYLSASKIKPTKASLCLKAGHHSIPIDFHCNNCKQLCCAVCLALDHPRHDFMPLSLFSATLVSEVEIVVQQAKDAEKELTVCLEKLRASHAMYKESSEKAEEDIRDSWEKIASKARARESELVEELRVMRLQKEKMFEAKVDSLECRAHRMGAVARMGTKVLKMEEMGEQQRVALLIDVRDAFCNAGGNDVAAAAGGAGDVKRGDAASEVVEYECRRLEEVVAILGDTGALKTRKDLANKSEPPQDGTLSMASFVQQRLIQASICLILCSALSSDGRLVVAGCVDATVRVWAVDTGQEMAVLKGHTGFAYAVAVSANSQYIVSGGYDGTLRVWAVGTWAQLAILEHTDCVDDIAFSGDGRYMISVCWDRTIAVWAVGTWKSIAVLQGHTDAVCVVAVSTDGRRFASGSEDRTVRVWTWTVGTWQQQACLIGHTRTVHGVALSRDGRYIVSGSADRTIRVWATSTWQQAAILCGHTSNVTGIAMSPDGRDDETVRVWAVGSWQQDALLVGHKGRVIGVDVSSDGRHIASCSHDETIRIWGSPSTD